MLKDIGYDEETAQVIAMTTHHSHTVSTQIEGIRLEYFDPKPSLPQEDLVDGLETLARVEALDTSLIARIVETFARLKKAEARCDTREAEFYRERDRCLQVATPIINSGMVNFTYEEARRYASTYAKDGELAAFLSLDHVRYQLEDQRCLKILIW